MLVIRRWCAECFYSNTIPFVAFASKHSSKLMQISMLWKQNFCQEQTTDVLVRELQSQTDHQDQIMWKLSGKEITNTTNNVWHWFL